MMSSEAGIVTAAGRSVSERSRSSSSTRGAERPLRLGVVGCGAVAERYHLPALLDSVDMRPAMFVDRELHRAERLSALVSGARAATDHRALAEHVDVAIVAVPNRWHASVASDLLRAGVHVLVEKPMARTAAECEQLCAAATDGRAVLAVGHDFRFFPVAQAAHRLLSTRMLGAIRQVDVRQSSGTRWPCLSSDALTADSGGGVVLAFGIHTFDLLLWWLGDLRPLHYADDACGGVEAECECDLLATHDNAPVHVEISRRRPLRDTTVVRCEHGTIEIGLFEPALLRITPDGGPPLDAHVVSPEFDRAPLKTVFQRQLADFVSAVESGTDPLVDGGAGMRAVALVEQCYAMRRPLHRSWDVPLSAHKLIVRTA